MSFFYFAILVYHHSPPPPPYPLNAVSDRPAATCLSSIRHPVPRTGSWPFEAPTVRTLLLVHCAPDSILTHVNFTVSNPSIVHRRSEQSITASEDYYSLSPSSSSSTYTPRHINDPAYSEATIIRYSTPPSRLRTPAHSRDNLNQVDDANLNRAALRGLGQRRQSLDSSSSRERRAVAMPAPLNYRADGGIRRKPVPSTVIENPNSPTSPIQPEDSVVADRSRYYS